MLKLIVLETKLKINNKISLKPRTIKLLLEILIKTKKKYIILILYTG